MFAKRKENVPSTDKPAEVYTVVPDAAAGEAAMKSVGVLAQALDAAHMYGADHKVTGQMLEHVFPILAEELAKVGRLTLTVTGDGLLANGALLTSQSGKTAGLVRCMHALGMPQLTLNRGFGLPELQKLMVVLTAPAPSPGSPPLSAQTLRDAGLSHVTMHEGTLRAVGDDEQVMRRDDVRRLRAVPAPDGKSRVASAALLEDARAFLQGQSAANRAAESDVTGPSYGERTLAQLLVEVARALQPGAPQLPAADIRTILQQAAKRALASTVAAQRTVQIIEKKAREPAPADTEKYKELIALISELAQELSQPLTVVNATIDMIRRRPPPDGNEGQSELLAMASDSGKRLAELVTRLVQIAGTPEALSPDAERLKTIYQAPGS